MPFTLEGKAALVTGAGRGIGRAIAQKLAGAGASVLVNDLDEGPASETVSLIRASGGRAGHLAGDVTLPAFPQRLVDGALAAFGGLDILVNNAGYTDSVAKAVGTVLGNEALISSAQSFSDVIAQAYGLVDRFSWLVGLAGLLIAVVGLLRAISSALRDRRRDIGLMRAVGWSRGDVAGQLTGEAVSLAAAGAVAGLLLALLVSRVLSLVQVSIPVPWELSPTPHFLPGGATPMAVMISLSARIDPLTVALAIGLSVLCGLVVGLWISRRATRIRPAEVLRSE